jgi:hypothetical protein
VPSYVYATEGNRIYANLYMSSRSEIELGGKQVVLRQRTEYPWEGSIEFEVEQPGRGFELALRIPGWARGEAVPSDLYTYTDPSADEAKIYVNGEEISFSTEKGYALINRKWQAGDKVRLELPMRVRQVRTHSAVVGNRGLLSVERGPIVYCAEGADNGGRVADLSLQADAKFKVVSDSLSIGGSYTLRGEGLRYAIEANRRRAYENSGSVIWQANELYPNVSSTSLLDYRIEGKPAYFQIAKAFAPLNVSLKYDKLVYAPGEVVKVEVFVTRDNDEREVTFCAKSGDAVLSGKAVAGNGLSVSVGVLEIVAGDKFVDITLTGEDGELSYENTIRLLVKQENGLCSDEGIGEFY